MAAIIEFANGYVNEDNITIAKPNVTIIIMVLQKASSSFWLSAEYFSFCTRSLHV